jgi:hypothetical protein
VLVAVGDTVGVIVGVTDAVAVGVVVIPDPPGGGGGGPGGPGGGPPGGNVIPVFVGVGVVVSVGV